MLGNARQSTQEGAAPAPDDVLCELSLEDSKGFTGWGKGKTAEDRGEEDKGVSLWKRDSPRHRKVMPFLGSLFLIYVHW